MENPPAFRRVAILGFGLIGASLARAIRKAGLGGQITAYDASAESLRYGKEQNMIDETAAAAADAAREADLVLIATPPAAFGNIAQNIGVSLKRGALVMDMGSVKEAAMQAIAPHLPATVDYIPAHPIAGREQSGAQAGVDSLFEGRRVIITPAPGAREHALHTAMLFWQALGSKPEAMPADLHDVIYATVSHLPQLAAFAAAPLVHIHRSESGAFPLFARFTRLCDSSPDLWAQIFALNAKPLLVVLQTYLQGVYQILSELREHHEEKADISPEEMAYCRMVLFPRIAASCLVGAVMTTERQINLPLARYAGSGFADVACPALEEPEENLKQISNYPLQIAEMLEEFMGALQSLQNAVQSDDIAIIQATIERLQSGAATI